GGMFVADKLASVLKIFSYLAVSLTLFYSRTYLAQRGLFRGETFVLMLTALLGMLVMISANNFVPLYLGLELMSLSLYALIALQRESERAIEAAMKYFVLGALASGLLLYGMSMIYGATGTLDIGAAADVMVRGTRSPCSSALRRSSPRSHSPCACSSARCPRSPANGRACCLCSRCCRCSSAMSSPSPRPTSSACSPIPPSPTWASCSSACSPRTAMATVPPCSMSSPTC